jgi:hypothetical protein
MTARARDCHAAVRRHAACRDAAVPVPVFNQPNGVGAVVSASVRSHLAERAGPAPNGGGGTAQERRRSNRI